MARDVNLDALKSGINRLRTKGGADPSSLYDLVNGYVTIDGSSQSRPGTRRKSVLPTGTMGMMAFDSKLWVFSHEAAVDPDSLVHVAVLSNPNDAGQPISAIHFAAPFMGYPYVAAEFSNGDVFHYWLQSAGSWQADTMYLRDAIVEPTTPNGLAYQASGGENPPSWQPSTTYAVGDSVQPTVYNGWKYTVIEADGDNPSSGTSEPVWPTSDGAQVIEDVDNTPAPSTPSGGSTPGGGRYSNLPGYKQDQLGLLE
jgi:hypothetical protein